MKFVKLLFINVIILVLFFLLLEGAARVFFPEFKNDYHSYTSRGVSAFIIGLQAILKPGCRIPITLWMRH